MRSPRLASTATLAFVLAWPALGQSYDRERPRKTGMEYEREAENVRTRDLAVERYDVPPLTSRPLKKAVADLRAGTSTLPGGLETVWGEFLAADRAYFVALQVSAAAGPELADGQKVVLFGEVTNAAGKAVFSFELDRRAQAAGDRLFVDLPMSLEPGEYTAVAGLADGKTPRAITSFSLAPAAIDGGEFGVSRLLLADRLFALPAAQRPDEPFAFGGIKVVPRGDRTFSTAGEAWLFVVIRNPGLDPAQGPKLAAPKLAVRVVIEPAGGAAGRREIPVRDAAPTALKGFDGQWGFGLPVQLASLSPGEYTVKLELEDLVQGRKVGPSASLHLVAR